MALRDFYQKTTKVFKTELKYNGIKPDIRHDEVSIIFKKRKGDLDSEAFLTKLADVTTEGLNGRAIFYLTIEDTDLEPGRYFYEIKWTIPIPDPELDVVQIVESKNIEILK